MNPIIDRYIKFPKPYTIIERVEEDLSEMAYYTPDPWNTTFIYHLKEKDFQRACKELKHLLYPIEKSTTLTIREITLAGMTVILEDYENTQTNRDTRSYHQDQV